AAMECPVVATRVPGCVDAVVEGETGMLVPVRDAQALTDALRVYLADRQLRQQHGKAARRWVQGNFNPEDIWAALHAEYLHIAHLRGVRLPGKQTVPEKRRAVA
ncbi:MAG: glycosyltransferase family 4 protein, partial [Planctomycetes bacterium]|nr:glycosyltransferase family 4 protein [Planctomycetota bacterium]